MMKTVRLLSSWLMCASLAACVMGPQFTPPTAVTPPAFDAGQKLATGQTVSLAADPPDQAWWHEFKDPELDALEDRTRTGNLDLQAGMLRIVEARTQVLVARAQGLPSLKGTASYNREQLGAAGILKAQGGTFGGTTLSPGLVSAITAPINLYQVGFDASWELDLFGKVSRSIEAAKAQSDEAVESRNDMLVSLEAEVAQTYLQLRAAQLLKSITVGLIAEEQGVLDLTINRQQHGLAEQGDVESARAQVATLRAQLPEYEQNISVSRHALAVLMGQNPEALQAELEATAALPDVPREIPAGIPSTLARRRPDIRKAEATLHAATAQVGVSVASMYPDISLTGSFGLRNTASNYLFNWSSKFYSAGPSVSVPLFQGGALIGNVKIAKAEAGVAALDYRKTVLAALQEVEDALVSLDQDAARVVALNDTVDANQRALDIERHSYQVGLTSYISVLNLELQTNQAKVQLAQASLSEVTDVVKLYKALGGGWES
jgi:NodT family efflux transporter outer membrane factor (OMF) lipoprotein